MTSSKERRAQQRKEGLPPDDPRHGKATSYTNYGCRCDACREAQTKDMAQHRTRMRAAGLPEGDPRHGTSNGYANYGCRCETCRAGHSRRRVAAPGNDRPVT